MVMLCQTTILYSIKHNAEPDRMLSVTTNFAAQLEARNVQSAALNLPSHTEIATRTVQELLAQFLATLPYPTWILSTTLHVQYTNPAMVKLLDMPPEQLLKRPVSRLVEHASQPTFEQLIQDAYTYPDSSHVGEITLCGARGQHMLVRFNVLPIPQFSPPLVMAIGQPLDDGLMLLQEVVALSTELETRNAQLEQVNAQLHKSEQQRKHVTSLLIHDIRSQLMATSASLEIMQRSLKESAMPSFVSEAVEAGLRSLRTAVELTNDVMDMKKLESGHNPTILAPINFTSFCAEIMSNFHALSMQQHVMLQSAVLPANLVGSGDQRLLRRVMLNLIANALRFTPTGETITIHVRRQDDQTILLAVADRGPGVAPAERERIFEPFMQGDGESARGFGLGLAFCREVINAHGGKIWVEENPGGGSRFCISLPQP